MSKNFIKAITLLVTATLGCADPELGEDAGEASVVRITETRVLVCTDQRWVRRFVNQLCLVETCCSVSEPNWPCSTNMVPGRRCLRCEGKVCS